MDNILQKIPYDESDPKFIQLKQEFIKEIKTYFNCESFDKVVEYVFEEIFGKKLTKEDSVEKFQSIFENKTEKIINVLWELMERIASGPKGDVLDEIFREKNEPKKFPSQIVNPSSNKPQSQSGQGGQGGQSTQGGQGQSTQGNQSQSNDRDYHNNRRDNRRKGSRDHRDYKDNNNNNYNSRDNNYNRNRRGGGNKFGPNPGDRMRVGNKEVIFHGGNNSRFERSRDRDRDNSNNYQSYRDRDRDRDNRDNNNKDNNRDRDNDGGDYDDDVNNNNPNYHHQNYRGGFNQRRGGFPMPFNPYYPTYPPMMGFVDPRRQFFRSKGNVRRNKGDGNNQQQQQGQGQQVQQEGEGDQQQQQQGQQGGIVNKPNNEDNTTITNSNQPKPNTGTSEEHKALEGGDKGDGQKKKVRCKNWPNCKEQGCEYSHPTQTCPFFPNCMFGDKCSYIHPNIKCKYGFNCTRINCAYSHPAGCNPGMAMYPNMMRPIPHFNKFKGKKNFGNKPQQGHEGDTQQQQQQDQSQPQTQGQTQQDVVKDQEQPGDSNQ